MATNGRFQEGNKGVLKCDRLYDRVLTALTHGERVVLGEGAKTTAFGREVLARGSCAIRLRLPRHVLTNHEHR